MSKHIEVYSNDDYTTHESEREYEEVGSFTVERQRDYDVAYVREVTTVYLDPITGLLVADIAAYEKWVR